MGRGAGVAADVEEHEGLGSEADWLQGEELGDGQGSASLESAAGAGSLD